MTKTLGRLDPKTRLVDIGSGILQSGINPGFGQVLIPGRILCTHMWTSATVGGTVNYVGVDETIHTIYMAADMGIFPVLFTEFIAGGSLPFGTIWWARTANYIHQERV